MTLGKSATLLGPNNHGKSNILTSLDYFLNSGFKLAADDFYSNREPADAPLLVEAEFSELSDQEKTTFSKYLTPTQTVKFQKKSTLSEGGEVQSEYHGFVRQPTLWWLRDEAFDRLKTREMITHESAEVPELSGLLAESGKTTRERLVAFQQAYISAHSGELQFDETLETSPLLGVKNIAAGTLPDFFLIPAVRELVDETKTSGTSAFGKLLQRAVSEMAATNPRFLELQQNLKELVGQLNERPETVTDDNDTEIMRLERTIQDELSAWSVNVSINVVPPDVKKVFELGTEIWLDDGTRTKADRKGHGLQRALIFSLIRAWSIALRLSRAGDTARSRASSDSVIFAFEEPELFLHPQAQRLLADSLRSIANNPQHQVFVCTHSTFFVNLDEYKSISIITKNTVEEGTKARQCIRELFAGHDVADRKHRFHLASWINPDRAELFFARKVVLVEGETEKTVIPYLAARLTCFDHGVSVIDCGSKHNLPLYIQLVNGFSFKYFVLHDEDPLPTPIPESWTPEKTREKTRTFALNAEIAALMNPAIGEVRCVPIDFEAFAGVSHSQAEKKGKALAALDHLVSLTDENLPRDLVDLVRRIYS
jgi:putative ATP-dependent endonuclease of OLD family